MLIAIGSDHAGFALKEGLKNFLENSGHKVTDEGPADDSRSDYPDYAKKVAKKVSEGRCERGVLVCGSGIGMCMAANRFKGARAVVIREETDAEMSRRHNDANIACLGARVTDAKKAERLLKVFLATPFEGGRHEVRVKKMG